jgi:phosphohistidine phosphatase SixA
MQPMMRDFWAVLPIGTAWSLFTVIHRNPSAVNSHRWTFASWVASALLAGITLFNVNVAASQTGTDLNGQALVETLREGGYNIYFRHAATDWSQHDQVAKVDDWISCDPGRIRQLADAGRRTASAIGAAMRALRIPVGHVFASPYCRTVETARLMQLGNVETTTDIMNTRVAAYFGGPSAIAERTRQRLSTLPQAGTNTVLVAHGNVLKTATDVYPQEAEAIVFRPNGDGSYSVVARLSPQAWERLVAEHGDR